MTLPKLLLGSLVWLALLLSAALMPKGFSFSGVSNRFITPNGDSKNDTAVFNFENPQYASVSGKVFDMQGKKVADMTAGNPSWSQLVWNAKSSAGEPVSAGAYVFVIEAEGGVFRGVVVVIR
ncbi:MAG: gliding motility-associated C-terminal domain-containing protein [Elusimicrobiota bacterium]|jgi:gliding motility-associated-like protein